MLWYRAHDQTTYCLLISESWSSISFGTLFKSSVEDPSTDIDGVNGNIVCLVENACDINIPPEQKVPYKKLREKTEKQICNEAMHISFVDTGFYKKVFA